MKDVLNFDLQRFNDVVQPSEDTNIEQVANPTETTSQDNQDDVSKAFDFMIDENGNLVFADDEKVETQDEIPVQQDFYTPDEIKEIGIDKLDPNKIPPELVPFYKSLQADYTRKTQDLAQKNKDVEAELAKINQTQQPQIPTQEQPQVDPKVAQRQYYENVYNLAKGNVEQALGEQFDEINPLHLSALADEVASIKAYVVQQQMEQRQLQSVLNKYSNDPEWGSIQKYAEQVLDNLPYSQSKVIRQRLESGDMFFIDQFLRTSHEEYYKSKNGVPVQSVPVEIKPQVVPPKVESAGSGITTPSSQSVFNPKQIRGMTNDQLANAFVGLGLVNL